MEKKNVYIETCIADTVMEKPVGFTVAGKRFYLYPPTLGKSYLLSRLSRKLEIDKKVLSANPYLEALRLAKGKRGIACRILAYHSLRSRRDIQDEGKVSSRAGLFAGHLDDNELAQLLVVAFSAEDVHGYISYLGIDKERAERDRIMKEKDKNGSVSFCGKSIYGTLVDWACQRYGWDMEYVVWGISYANLQMLMADAITTVYLSDGERKKFGIRKKQEFVNADDPRNFAKIRAMLVG